MTSASSLPGTLKSATRSFSASSPSSSIGLGISFEPSIPFVESLYLTLGVNIKSFRVPLDRAIREVLIPSIRANFDQGGRPDRWDPLSPVTILMREFYGFGGQDPLIRTGALRRVATQINMWDVTTEDATYKELPEKVWYGQIQNDGYQSNTSLSPKAKATTHNGAPRLKYWQSGYTAQQASLGKAEASQGREVSIPARPFIMIQPEDEIKIQAIFEEWLDMRIAAVKF